MSRVEDAAVPEGVAPPVAVGISGSPSRPSRSRALLEQGLERLRSRGVRTRLIDLSTLPAEGLLGRASSSEVDRALAELAAAGIVVASTPVYKGSYSGLLKTFFDLLPPNALSGAVAIPVGVGALPEHLPLVEHSLRALLASLGARVVPSGTFAAQAQLESGHADAGVTERLDRAVEEALALAAIPASAAHPSRP